MGGVADYQKQSKLGIFVMVWVYLNGTRSTTLVCSSDSPRVTSRLKKQFVFFEGLGLHVIFLVGKDVFSFQCNPFFSGISFLESS